MCGLVHNYVCMVLLRLRQSGKKKKRIRIKRPGGKKDEMKLMLLKLKSIVHMEQTDGGSLGEEGQREGRESLTWEHGDSESDKGSVDTGMGNESPQVT